MQRQYLDDNPNLALLVGAMDEFSGHGWGVGHVIRSEAASSAGFFAKPVIEPVEDLFEKARFHSDDYGNPGMTLRVDTEKYLDAVRKMHDAVPDLKVLNWSGQLGDITAHLVIWERGSTGEVIEHDPPQLRIVGAFSPDRAEDSLREFAEVGKELEKIGVVFVGAAGNNGDVPNRLLKQGVVVLPSNSMLVGEWREDASGSGRPVGGIESPLYTRNSGHKWNYWEGSSVSAGILSFGAAVARFRDVEADQVPAMILRDFSDQQTYRRQDPDLGDVMEEAVIYNSSKLRVTFGLPFFR